MSTHRKIAVITGAGSGIGRATTLKLLQNGYEVVLAGRNVETLKSVIDAAGPDGSRTLTVVTDVSQPDSVRALFSHTKDVYGRIDVVFNNAGIGSPPILLEDLTSHQWNSVVNVNLSGAFYCTQQAFQLMKTQDPMGGRIINNGSISAHSPRPNSVAYTATKHAITGLTKATALDGRKYDIACSQIDIGNAKTSMTARMSDGVLQANGQVEQEPLLDVEHVASAVLYMADLPLNANVQFMTIMATKMPFIGRG